MKQNLLDIDFEYHFKKIDKLENKVENQEKEIKQLKEKVETSMTFLSNNGAFNLR